MENLKNLMGAAYHEGITVEEINTFLATGKFVNLKEGNYVDKEKLTRVESDKASIQKELDSLKESTKDYETLKNENATFKSEKADNDLKTKLVGYGISEKSFKYVKGDISEGTLKLGDDDAKNKEAVTAYLKDHTEFASNPNPASNPNAAIIGRIFKSGANDDPANKGQNPTDHKSINDAIRAAAGIKLEGN